MHLNVPLRKYQWYLPMQNLLPGCQSVLGRFNVVSVFFELVCTKVRFLSLGHFFTRASESNSQTLLNIPHNLINCITHVHIVAHTYDMSDVLYLLCRLKGFQNPLIPTMVNINSDTHYKPPLITFQCSFLSGCLWKNEVMLTREL